LVLLYNIGGAITGYPFFSLMTKIKNEQRIAIEALKNAGIGYGAIGKQLELKKSTVAKHIQTKSLIAQIGPKVKFSRAAINGRKSFRVKNFIKCN
jgi:IS30 family transposase